VLRATGCTFAVDGLRTGDEHFADGKVVIANDLQHLSCAKAIDEDVLRHLRHIATIGSFVKDDVDVG